ncbi:MAG: serine hydrolase [Candidatus Paceibacterota bacterium]|jgi:D-alanyl-D-alanine carboxypeptidase
MNGQARNLKFFLFFALIFFISFWAVSWLQKEKTPYGSLTAQLGEEGTAMRPNRDEKTTEARDISSSTSSAALSFDTDAKAAIAVAVALDEKEEEEVKILFEKDADKKLPIASLTKLMTAAIALENYSLEEEMAITQKTAETSSMSLDFSGEKFTVENVLRVMLIESNNDAATSLAERMGEKKFIELMNFKAAELGMDSTLFVNPNGLDESDSSFNISSALDLSKLVVYIENNFPFIGQTLSNKKFTVVSSGGRSYDLVNTNVLLYDRQTAWGKTGYTKKANGCIINIVKPQAKSGYAIINIVLGADDRFYEAQRLTDWINNYFIW